AGLNALYHPDAVVRVDDLLTDLEIHTNLAFHTRQLVGCLRAFFGRGTDLSKSHIGRANLEPSVSFAERSYADEGARGRGRRRAPGTDRPPRPSPSAPRSRAEGPCPPRPRPCRRVRPGSTHPRCLVPLPRRSPRRARAVRARSAP